MNLGHNQEGIQALNVFLKESPRHPIAGQVRNLIAEIQEQTSAPAPAPGEDTQQANARLTGIDPLLALAAPKLSVKAWLPPGIDDLKLSLAEGIACPSGQVIEESGRRVQELVEDVTRFAAVEDLFHQALDEYGSPLRTETRKYNYVASISEPQPGFLSVDEYRADKLTVTGYPDQIASTGFAALALVFQPDMRDNFAMICEGLGDWHGQATWLMHFRERDDKPSNLADLVVGGQRFPMPEIQLLSEHQVVDYGPVPFARKNTSLWLPKSAEIYFDFRKHRYYRRHSFDHYMLFSAETEEKRKEPSAPPVVEKKS